MKLMAYERKLLAHYILQSSADRANIRLEAHRDRKVSGPLIQAYEAVELIL